MDKEKIGVIVGRFQVPELHEAHRSLLRHVSTLHNNILVILGIPKTKSTRRNPMDYDTRKLMIQAEVSSMGLKNVSVTGMVDTHNDITWSKAIDKKIKTHSINKGGIIYGGRDSCIPNYHGNYETEEVSYTTAATGSRIRQLTAKTTLSSKEFRCGVIYGAHDRFPTSLQCIDIAVMKGKTHVVLARKRHEDAWRFPGGFVDPTDDDLEMAAKREAIEELGDIQIDDLTYICSKRIADPRFAKEIDKVMTVLYSATYMWGIVEAHDDITQAQAFKLKDITNDDVMPEHQSLMDALIIKMKVKEPKWKQSVPISSPVVIHPNYS